MKTLKPKEAITILAEMKINSSIPKAAVTQIKRNAALNMAIDALLKCSEIPNDSDTISRQAAIDAVDKLSDEPIGYLEAAMDVLADLPSAEPEPQWIPCSERLPDMWDERYLVSLAWGGIGVVEYKSTGFHNYGAFTPVPIESIIAWMPLPEPYQTGGEKE